MKKSLQLLAQADGQCCARGEEKRAHLLLVQKPSARGRKLAKLGRIIPLPLGEGRKRGRRFRIRRDSCSAPKLAPRVKRTTKGIAGSVLRTLTCLSPRVRCSRKSSHRRTGFLKRFHAIVFKTCRVSPSASRDSRVPPNSLVQGAPSGATGRLRQRLDLSLADCAASAFQRVERIAVISAAPRDRQLHQEPLPRQSGGRSLREREKK